jgi:class 3 adenylate cyclase
MKKTDQSFLEQEEKQQAEAIETIVRYGIVISAVYAVLYYFLAFQLLVGFMIVMTSIYIAIYFANKNKLIHVRAIGVLFMFMILIHTVGLGAVFTSPSTNIHLWVIIVPFFSIITIHKKDSIWSLIVSTIAVGVLVYIEKSKDTFIPALAVEFHPDILPFIRGASILLIILFVTGIFWLYYQRLSSARKELAESYERSESLLLNILPSEIAERLKNGATTIADDIDEASVLFCDLVGFTTIASTQTAKETVEMLNGVFVEFDEAIETRGLEKIKTIGDAYMVASGVPKPRPDHAEQMIYLAQDLFIILDKFNQENNYDLSLRIGINCGPVTAGVIGTRKFSYDLWGDTVNVASRMESSGIPNHIHVSQSVADAAQDVFHFEKRDKLKIKGKGEMQTYLLIEKK